LVSNSRIIIKHSKMTSTDLSSALSKLSTAETLNPFDSYRKHVAECIAPIVDLKPEFIASKLQWTQTLDKGDLMLPVPALQLKGKKPPELAAEIASKFPESDLVEKPTSIGIGVQFFFKPVPLTSYVLTTILKNKSTYGTNMSEGLKDPKDPKSQKFIIVEFSSPNIAKEFHAGHLRSTIIGGFIANLYEANGWKVLRMNYLGDWGKQFGLLAHGYKTFGSEEELKTNAIGHLFNVYVRMSRVVAEQEPPIKALKEQIKAKKAKSEDVTDLEKELDSLVTVSEDEKARKYFKSMEDGDPESLALWDQFRIMSIEKYKKTYDRLNIHFDEFSGESQVKRKTIQMVSKELMEKKISQQEPDGSIIINFANHGAKKLGIAVIQRKDGTPLYLTRDMAAIRERYEKYHFDRMIYVVASQQDLHLAQFFKVTELSGHREISDKCEHISFGMVKGMSTRRGTVKFLDDIIRDVSDYMHDVMRQNELKYQQVETPEEVSETLGITAIMVQDMKGKRVNGYTFSLDDMTSFEGDTGPYLQYAHARLCSIQRKAGIDMSKLASADFSLLTEPQAVKLVRTLSQWPDQVLNTLKTKEPTTVLTYLFKMTHELSSSYDVLQVIGSEPALLQARLALYEAARQVLNNGMKLLGLSPVERM
jgi:arginyl-tRNA synthetase